MYALLDCFQDWILTLPQPCFHLFTLQVSLTDPVTEQAPSLPQAQNKGEKAWLLPLSIIVLIFFFFLKVAFLSVT